MRKQVVAALVGIAALAAGSAVLLVRLTADGGPRPAWEAPPPPEPSALAPLPALPPGYEGRPLIAPDTGKYTPQELARLGEVGPARPVPAADSWEAVPIGSSRVRSGDPATVAVGQELNELHDALSGCFEPGTASRQGAATPSRVAALDEADELGTTVLVLQLETLRDAVRVVDAPVQAGGGASDATLACVQAQLRGKVFQAPGTRAGKRQRLQYKLIP